MSAPRAGASIPDAVEDSSRLTRPGENAWGEESARLPVESAGTEGSRPEESGDLESLFAPFPHLKTALALNESGSDKGTAAEEGTGEADTSNNGVGGAAHTARPVDPIEDMEVPKTGITWSVGIEIAVRTSCGERVLFPNDAVGGTGKELEPPSERQL